jgi:hypothetical protein
LVLPKSYPPRTPEEIQAINTFKALLDPHQVIAHIEELSTVPDVDGHLDVLSDNLKPIAKLEVQVRKLPDNFGPSPKLQIDLSIFGYASVTTSNPVLLIGVDIHEKRAYWYHVPMNVNPPTGQETVMIHFPLTQVIDGTDTKYVVEWLAISQEHHRKLIGYDELLLTLRQLSARSTLTTATLSSPGYPKIHEFLDELNSLIDGPFTVVKRRFYPGCWKLGLAYRDFSPTSVTYVLYPIRPEENQAQIKTIDATQNLLSIRGLRGYSGQNPISERPRKHATEVIKDQVNQLLKGKLLDNSGSRVLATEFMFATTDRFAEQMGLEKKDTFGLTEIEYAFYCHLPFWVDEAIRFMVREKRNGVTSPFQCLYRKPYFNPDMLSHQIMPEEMKQLDELVETRISRNDPVPKIPIGYEHLPLGLFDEYSATLIAHGATEIHRLYEPPDFSRIPQGGHFWDAYSPESAERNLRALFTNFPQTYFGIVEQNFPQLKSGLPPFMGATRIIAFFDAKDEIGSYPSLTLYYLRRKDERDLHIELYRAGENPAFETKFSRALHDRHTDLEGKPYECIAESSSGMQFKFDELPLFDLVYEELQGAFRSYFNEIDEPKV